MESTQESPTQNGQLVTTTKTIEIKVKVASLFLSINPPTSHEIDKCTELSNSGGSNSPYGQTKKHFKTDVKKDEMVRWRISEDTSESGHQDYKLNLLNIFEKSASGNLNIFGINPLYPKPNGTIKEQVLYGNINNYYDYFILFSITRKSDDDTRSFAIDPQLKMT